MGKPRATGRSRILLSECTLLDVEERLQRSPKVIIPVGATEQHGPHAPFGTDSILATEVSVRLARRIEALVAPTLTYGVSGDHRGYPGVPFVSAGTMTALVQDVVLSLAGGGFREIILVNGHYTNSIVLSAAIMEIGDRLPPGTIAFPFNYWDALPPDELAAYLGAEVGLHANVGETSAVLAVDESLVDLDLAVREYPAFPVEPTPAMVSAYFFSARGTLPRASRSGVWGDPSGSSAELGRRYLDQIEEASVRFVENVESLFRAFPENPKCEELVAALAHALDVPLAPERLAAVAAQLEGQLAGRGGLPAEELEGVEPAPVFEPGWGA